MSILLADISASIDRLTSSNIFTGYLAVFIGAILSRLAARYRRNEITLLIWLSALIMSGYIIKEVINIKDFSAGLLFMRSFPIIAALSWIFASAAFRRDIRMQTETLEIKSNAEFAEIKSRLDSIINQRNASIVKLPDDFPLGPRIQSRLTINQMLIQLVSTSSAEQQRSIARSHLGQFVMWKCKIYSWESIGNGQLQFTLGTVDGIHPSIFVKVPESESAHVKALPPLNEIIVDGRIYEICTLSRHVRIDYANLTLDNDASSHPSGAAPSP